MRYWWVNHKQTARQEIAGGYLWSPKREASGARSQFYENMRIAEPGEIVLSFSDGMIRYVGHILDFARPVPKPSDFGAAGENWSNDGWLLPIAWNPTHHPVRPKEHMNKLGPILPKKYSPINPATGNGNQKAYLAEINGAVVELLVGLDVPHVKTTLLNYDADARLHQLDDLAEHRLLNSSSIDPTTKQQIVLARRGQGVFRVRVSELEKACRLTGVTNPRLLMASHIKPWRTCVTATERLDGANGLLLAPHVDRLFDRGFISFEADGRVLVSPRLNPIDLEKLGLSNAYTMNCGSFTDEQAVYLAFHRSNVLLSQTDGPRG